MERNPVQRLKDHLNPDRRILVDEARSAWGQRYDENGNRVWWLYGGEKSEAVVATNGIQHFIKNGQEPSFCELEFSKSGSLAAVGHPVESFNTPRAVGQRQVIWL